MKGYYEEWLKEDKLLLLKGWVREGLTNEQIAKKMNINVCTIYDWCNRFPNFADIFKKTKEVVDYEVENALLKKALGFRETVKKAFKCKKVWYDENGKRCEEEFIKQGEEDLYVPPETTAIIYWLNNRMKDKWTNKVFREEEPDNSCEKIANALRELVTKGCKDNDIADSETTNSN